MLGSFFLIVSASIWEAISRKTPPWGEPRPAFTSAVMALATTSLVSKSGGRLEFLSPASQRLHSFSCLRENSQKMKRQQQGEDERTEPAGPVPGALLTAGSGQWSADRSLRRCRHRSMGRLAS